jgi:hypothetical protein
MRFLSAGFAMCLFVTGDRLQADLVVGGQTVTSADTDVYNALTSNGGDALRTEIFNAMVQASNETFTFQDVAQAQTHFGTRIEIVNTIKLMGVADGIDFGLSGGNPSYAAGWASMEPTRKTVPFRRKADTSTSQALRNIESGQTRADCITCAKASVFIGFRRSRGDAWIDGMYPQTGSLAITRSDPTDELLRLATSAKDTTVKVPGDILFMRNYNPTQYVELAKKNGVKSPAWSGEACIYIGGGNYEGLDVAGMSEGSLRTKLSDAWTNEAKQPLTDEQINMIKFKWHSRIKIIP